MVSEYVTIKPETMPPTASAAAFHAYQAFYHTQKWIRYSYKEIGLETHLRLNLNFGTYSCLINPLQSSYQGFCTYLTSVKYYQSHEKRGVKFGCL